MSCQGFVLLILNLIYSWDNVWGFFQTCLVTRISSIWVAGRVGIYFLQTRPWYLDEPHFSQGNWSFSCLGSQEMDFGLWQQGLDWKQGMERMELMTVIRKCPLIPKKSGNAPVKLARFWVWLRHLTLKSRLTGKTTWMVGAGSDGRWTPSPSFLFQSFCRLPFVFMYQKIESLWLIDILQIGFKAPPVQNSLQVEYILQECILWLAICCIALLRPLNSHNKLGQRTFRICLSQVIFNRISVAVSTNSPCDCRLHQPNSWYIFTPQLQEHNLNLSNSIAFQNPGCLFDIGDSNCFFHPIDMGIIISHI